MRATDHNGVAAQIVHGDRKVFVWRPTGEGYAVTRSEKIPDGHRDRNDFTGDLNVFKNLKDFINWLADELNLKEPT